MEIKINSYTKQSSLLSALVCFIFGGILYTNAGTVLSVLSIIIGSILGIICLIFTGTTLFARNKSTSMIRLNTIGAIFTFILALIFLSFPDIIEFLLGITIGGWILLTGILRIINAIRLPKKNTRFITNIIVSALLISIGIYTIASGSILIETAGIIMMISAGIEIIGYIINKVLDDSDDNFDYEKKDKTIKYIIDDNDNIEINNQDDVKFITEKMKNKAKKQNEEVQIEKLLTKRRKRKTKVKDITIK